MLDELAADAAWEALGCMGIASAGPVDTVAGTVSPVNVPAWHGFPLVERVRSHPRMPAGARPALVGDAVAMTAAEHWIGAARGVDNALCMVVSTGVGGGLVLGGALHAGVRGTPGTSVTSRSTWTARCVRAAPVAAWRASRAVRP